MRPAECSGLHRRGRRRIDFENSNRDVSSSAEMERRRSTEHERNNRTFSSDGLLFSMEEEGNARDAKHADMEIEGGVPVHRHEGHVEAPFCDTELQRGLKRERQEPSKPHRSRFESEGKPRMKRWRTVAVLRFLLGATAYVDSKAFPGSSAVMLSGVMLGILATTHLCGFFVPQELPGWFFCLLQDFTDFYLRYQQAACLSLSLVILLDCLYDFRLLNTNGRRRCGDRICWSVIGCVLAFHGTRRAMKNGDKIHSNDTNSLNDLLIAPLSSNGLLASATDLSTFSGAQTKQTSRTEQTKQTNQIEISSARPAAPAPSSIEISSTRVQGISF